MVLCLVQRITRYPLLIKQVCHIFAVEYESRAKIDHLC